MKATRTELKQELGKLLNETKKAPVVITSHGKESHVLMTIEDYRKLLDKKEEG
jgi:prevent-host-death family protein